MTSPVCLTTTHVCVQCESTADCGGDPNKQCSTSNTCVYRVGKCGEDSDCATLPTTPICDATHETCVGCLVDTDCPTGQSCAQETDTCGTPPPPHCSTNTDCTAHPATPFCDTTTDVCVQCMADGECPMSNPVCRQGTCGPSGCENNDDCGAELLPVCNDLTGQCVQCLAPSDCTGSQACVQNACGPCQQDSDCAGSASGDLCSPTSGCVQCLQNTDCPTAGATCTNHVCVGGPCTGDADCANNPAGSFCDTTTAQCVQCRTTTDCTTGLVCMNDVCGVPVCHSDSDCVGAGGGPYCDTRISACVQCIGATPPDAGTVDAGASDGGLSPTDGGSVSDGGAGQADGGSAGLSLTAPDGGPQCVDAQTCQYDSCQPQACAATTDCAMDVTGRFCDTTRMQCVECLQDSDCPSGQSCLAESCGTAATCTSDNSCAATDACVPLADNGAWIERCLAASTSGTVRGGGACSNDGQCRSNVCYFPPAETVDEDGICLDGCLMDADCDNSTSNCPTYGVSLALPAASGPTGAQAVAPVCWSKRCTNDEACVDTGQDFTARVCAPTPNPRAANGMPALNCLPEIGYVPGGNPCAEDSDCASGHCLSFTIADTDAGPVEATPDAGGTTVMRCYGACQAPTDCAGTAAHPPVCFPTTMDLDGVTITINSCVVPP